MSRQYATCGGKADPAPAAAQIAWLTKQLDAARRSHEKVWVMSHIPPGVNPYATATKVLDLCSGGKPQMFFTSEALPDAMADYGDVIKLAIFAHTHMDEMRLLKPTEAGAPAGGVAVKMVGSISPVNGNNPSFTVAEVDAATAQLKDYQVFVASNQTGVDARSGAKSTISRRPTMSRRLPRRRWRIWLRDSRPIPRRRAMRARVTFGIMARAAAGRERLERSGSRIRAR